MRKDWTPAPKANETKQRIPVWLYPPEAAEAGQARTQYALGKIYRDGQGVEKDVQKAVELFTLAAMQGNSFAAFALGKMYLSDDPALSRNVAAALKWITNAAEHTHSISVGRNSNGIDCWRNLSYNIQ